MTKDFLNLMHLFSCGAHGNEPGEILTDIENGGVFGKKDKSRNEFYKEATYKRSNKTYEEFIDYIEMWKCKPSFVNRFFLPLSQTKK